MMQSPRVTDRHAGGAEQLVRVRYGRAMAGDVMMPANFQPYDIGVDYVAGRRGE
jgi:hypothetical protein